MKSMEVNQMSAETRKEFTPMELQWVKNSDLYRKPVLTSWLAQQKEI